MQCLQTQTSRHTLGGKIFNNEKSTASSWPSTAPPGTTMLRQSTVRLNFEPLERKVILTNRWKVEKTPEVAIRENNSSGSLFVYLRLAPR